MNKRFSAVRHGLLKKEQQKKMTDQVRNLYDLSGEEYTAKLASKLSPIEEFNMPEWASYVKTSTAKERPPTNADWWKVRVASILRQIYIHGTVGVIRLATKYGSKKDRGMRPERFRQASKKIIRVILQQGEKAGFLEKVTEKRHGRRLTKKGKAFLDQAAGAGEK